MTCKNIFLSNSLEFIPQIFKNYGTLKRFSSGEIVFVKDEPADFIYYVVKGQARAFFIYPNGEEHNLIYVHENTTCGEEVFAMPPTRIVCCSAITNLITYQITPKMLLQMCLSEKTGINELLSVLMKKITLLHNWIFYAQFIKNEEKLACLLYSYTKVDKDRVILTHEQIAEVTGMSRITTTRILNSFVKKGLISQKYKLILVHNRNELQKIFEHTTNFII